LLVDVGEASMMSRDFYGPATTNAIETGTIQYQLAKSDLRESEIIKPEIQNLIKNLKASGKRSYIEITSAASPEGAERINTSLATHRDMEATQYLEREMKKSNIELPIKHTLIDEDWDGLYKNIEASNMPDKNRMIQEMKAEGNLDKRQVILHKYMASNGLYEASLLPPLRRSKITLHVVNEEKLRTIDIHSNTPAHAIIESASDRKISNLTLEDRLAVTAAMADPDERIKSYRAIIIQHPNDWRAYNNLATVYLDKKDWNEASKLIDHSIKVQEHPENRYNQGFIHLAKGNMTDAKTCFSKAVASSSPEWKNARGAAEILNGNYSKAVATYGDQVCNNAALAQILNKDYSKAASTLSNIGAPNATTYYLKAIVGARTNNKDMVYNNLKEVMARNTQLGNWAKTDVEFAHYMGDSRFTSILQ
jgi:tetratricopeptide (TPR) repeat protein